MEFYQIIEELLRPHVCLIAYPLVIIYNFFAFVNQCLPHCEELLSAHAIVSVTYSTRLVLKTGHFEHLYCMGMLSTARKTPFVKVDRARPQLELLLPVIG